MNYFLKHIIYLIFVGVLTLFVLPEDLALAEEVPTSENVVSTDKSDKKSSKSSKTKKDSAKSDKSKSKKATTSKSKKTSKKSSNKSKKKAFSDKVDKTAEARSNAAQPIFSAKEIEQYRSMPYETWESPSGVSELGLPMEPGFVQPYPYGNLMRQYCTTNSRHRGHDIGVVDGKNGGMGSVINAVTRSIVTFIGKTGEDIGEFGKIDKRTGEAIRTGKAYPRQILVPGYGLVYPFSLNYGRWRSGNVIVTKVLDGPLKDYTIRYMHMGAIRPDLKVGSIVEAGEHIAVMGATSIIDSPPHVHLDMETPSGARANMSPYLGIPQATPRCKSASLPKTSVTAKTGKSSKKSTSQKTGKTKSKSSKKSDSSSKSPQKRNRKAYISKSESADTAQTRTLSRN